MQSLFYSSNDGLKLHYLFWPSTHTATTSNSCCILLHGFTNDAHIWDGLSAKLQQQHDVIAVDFRGHGDSDWDEKAHYSHQHLLTDIHDLIKQLSYEHIHIIGHSLGARVATLMLGRTDIKASSFTIIDTGPEVRAVGVDKVRKDAENTPKSFTDVEAFHQYLSSIYLFGQNDRIRLMAENGLKRLNGQWVFKTDPAFTAALWKPESSQGNSDDLRAPLNEELWQSLSQIHCPSLILKGQASAILAKKTAEKMAFDVMPNAQFKTIRRAGHAIMVDNPNEFEATVTAFISQL